MLNSLIPGDKSCFAALTNGVPSGFLFLVRPGFPCFLETPYMHGELMMEQRAQVGCSLLHLTFDAAQESQEARSFGLLYFLGIDGLGAEVGDDILSVVFFLSIMIGARQRNGRDGRDIIVDDAASFGESVSGEI